MKTKIFESHLHPALKQLHKNTSLWVGHINDDQPDHAAGQTFQCPDNGDLDEIQVYSIIVTRPGHMILTLHEFDKQNKQWGRPISSSEIEVDVNDADHWIKFPVSTTYLNKDLTYGFQIKSPDTMVALGEAAWPSKTPFEYGEEWSINDVENEDHYYRYFSLAFKVALRAA